MKFKCHNVKSRSKLILQCCYHSMLAFDVMHHFVWHFDGIGRAFTKGRGGVRGSLNHMSCYV